MADQGLNVELPDNSSFSGYLKFTSFCMKTYSVRLLPKQITIKQLHLNSKEIVYLSTQGSEIGLRMMQHLVRRRLFCNDNCNGPGKTRIIPPTRFYLSLFFSNYVKTNLWIFFHLCDKEQNVPQGQEGYNPVNKHYV